MLAIKFIRVYREVQPFLEDFLATLSEPYAGFLVGGDAGYVINELLNPCTPFLGFGLDVLDIKAHVKVRLQLARDVSDCQSYEFGVVE